MGWEGERERQGVRRPLKVEKVEKDGAAKGWRERGGKERAGEVATSPRKSRVMPTRNCTTPRAPLPTPPRSRLALTPLACRPVRFSRFFHRPSVSLSRPPPPLPLPLSPLSPLSPRRDLAAAGIPPFVPRVWCAPSLPPLRVTSPDPHPPPGNNPLAGLSAVSGSLARYWRTSVRRKR